MTSRKLKIMIVDDEEPIRDFLSDFVTRLGHTAHKAENSSMALQYAKECKPDLALLDICMPGMDGLELLERLHSECPDVAVIMISSYGTMDRAIQALRLGASDFLKKPVSLTDVEVAIERCGGLIEYRREKRELTGAIKEKRDNDGETGLFGESETIKRARERLRLAAESACDSILINGETGCGKEVAAKYFHRLRCGPAAPFVAVNCPALPERLIESELFGHVKGAFTGASEDRLGAFELAHRGVLFLDEVADLTPEAQAKLLRVLEERSLRRIGGSREVKVEVTVIAASNRLLEDCVNEGTFRADLYFRLNTFSVELPPLRERKKDIIALAKVFLEEYTSRLGAPAPMLAENAKEKLLTYHYPGNVRELRNIIERGCIMSGGDTIEEKHLSLAGLKLNQPECLSTHTSTHETSVESDHTTNPNLSPAVEKIIDEAEETRAALDSSGWNRRKAAETLDISYEALRWRIKKYDLKK